MEITKLDENKATGPFSIPTKILKPLKELLSKPLEILFNHSFSSGVVPELFKLAKVIPVFKKGLQTSIIIAQSLSCPYLIGFWKN